MTSTETVHTDSAAWHPLHSSSSVDESTPRPGKEIKRYIETRTRPETVIKGVRYIETSGRPETVIKGVRSKKLGQDLKQ